jgi:hypothetical protein
MANEFQITLNFAYNPAGPLRPISPGQQTLQQDQATPGQEANTLTIGTSEESFTFGADIEPAYWLYLQNLDSTNYVQIGFSTGVYGIRLRAGDFALLPVEPSSTLFALANTADVELSYIVYST